MAEPIVFISYSRRDEAEKNKLISHLGVLQQTGLISIWNDDYIRAGEDWDNRIKQIIAQAKIAVLLITANFLNSEFILSHEIPELLRRRQSEGLVVLPVIARACAWRAVDWLQQMSVRPKNGTPVWAEGGVLVDENLSLIAEEILDVVKAAKSASAVAPASANPATGALEGCQPEPAKLGPWRILIVDDEPSWQRRLSRILREINCTVVTAGDYDQVDAMLNNLDFDFDLVTVDLNLDKSTRYADGLELALRIRETFGHKIPIIIITGTGNLDEQRRAFKEYQVFDFIQKARLDLEEFQDVVLEALNGSQTGVTPLKIN